MSHDLNFLHRIESEPGRATHAAGLFFRRCAIAAAILFSIWATVVIGAAVVVGAAALDGKDGLLRARDAAVALNFDLAEKELSAADASFARAEKGFVVLRTARFVPWLSTQVQAADALLSSGRSVISALMNIVEIGGDVVRLSGLTEDDIAGLLEGVSPDLTFEELPSETKRLILRRLSASASDLELTQAKIALAREELEAVSDENVVSPILDALRPFESRLIELEDIIRTLSVAAHVLPEFAGLEGERSHLLLFLNNTELRPGGGFVGTYGILGMRDGDIANLKTQDVYRLDDAAAPFLHTTPPKALQAYNASSTWFFRDANWSPDFAMSARELMELFRAEVNAIPEPQRSAVQSPVTIHGVIGFTPTYASELLKITGPIQAGGQTFTPENLSDRLEYQVEFGYVGQNIPPQQRKEILSELVEKMKSRLFALPLAEWPRVIDATEEALRTKQLVFYSENQRTEDVLTAVGWAGRVLPDSTDVQLAVDANLASLKSDPAVARTIRYEIFRNTNKQYVGRTTITYAHTGTFNWKTTRYRTYTRLYVPAGSELIRASGTLIDDKRRNPSGAAGPVDVGSELGLTTFGAFTSVEPGETRELSFEYLLSGTVVDAIRDGSYRLQFYKQIGAAAHPLTLKLDFDKNVTSASPPEDADQWGDDTFHLNTKLDQDSFFEVSL